MSLRNATLIAIIGQFVGLVLGFSSCLGRIRWTPTLAIIINTAGPGCLLVFLITLYLKQQTKGDKDERENN